MTMRRYAAWLFAAVSWAPALVGATTVRFYSEPEMVKAAAAIVHGTVVAVTPQLEQGLIVTKVSVQVTETWKGSRGQSRVTLTQLGGTLDGRTTHVAGTNTYEVGEEVVLFLEPGGGGLVEMGVGAGKYVVKKQGGVPMIERKLGKLAFARVDGKNATPVAPPLVRGPEALASFKARVFAELRR